VLHHRGHETDDRCKLTSVPSVVEESSLGLLSAQSVSESNLGEGDR
jgi:hypothetical protein